MTDTPLVFAIPSKGRILESAQGFLDRSGLKPVQGRGARDYRGTIPGLDQVEVAFLSASDIAKELAAGTAHIGLTGLDLMHEATPEPEDRPPRAASQWAAALNPRRLLPVSLDRSTAGAAPAPGAAVRPSDHRD